MNLQFADFLVLAAYFIITIAAGVWFTRSSAQGLRSYFLGENKQKWWMLACSGSASNYSVDGTVWNISMLMVLGMMSWYTTLIWWLPNPVILMAFTAIWIRRTGAVTSADLNTVRFGSDGGARAARIGFAVLISTFSIMQICMSYVVLHKFATIFGFPGHFSAMLLVGSTGLYVLFGGFNGVILTDFIQNLLLLVVSFVIAFLCVVHYDKVELEAAIPHRAMTIDEKLAALDGLQERTTAKNELAIIAAEREKLLASAHGGSGDGISEPVTLAGWKSLKYQAKPPMGRFADSSYSGWNDFAGAALAWSVVGIIGCFGGAGGRYGEQRYLAAKNAKQAAWQAALWQVLVMPRWILTAGLAFLAFTLFREQTVEVVKVVGGNVVYSDPDAIFPIFTSSSLLAPGMRGLVVATLTAAYMSTFSSEINAAAGIMVHDIWQPLCAGDRENARGTMAASYGATLWLIAAAMGCGWMFTEYSSLNGVWTWMLGGLITCVVVPLALRWYWGRMNGWGFAAGCGIGFLPALLMLSKQFLPAGAWVQAVPDAWFTYSILFLSLAASIVVSLLTEPVEAAHIDRFYRNVRPFGFWGGIRERAMASGEPANAPLKLRYIPINIVLGVVATYSLYLVPVCAIGHWFGEAAIALGVFAVCVIVLYFTWFRTLPED